MLSVKQARVDALIVGDFNYPNINLDNWECNKDDEEFLDLLQDNFLYQHVDISTRVSNILDLVITNEISMVEGDYKAIKAAMKDINWHEELYNKNTLECYKVFTGKLSEVINAHIPVKKLRTKNKCMWCNRKVGQPNTGVCKCMNLV